MRTVTYKSVQDKANVLFAGKVAATTDDATSLNKFINARYREFFERFWWPEVLRVERRFFRATYSGTGTYLASTPTAPVEVYYWPPQAYYQALRANPITATTISRVTTTVTVTVAGGHQLTTGSHPRVTVSGVTPSGYNGTWDATVTSSTVFTYLVPADPGAFSSGTITVGIHPADTASQPVLQYWAASWSSYTANDWAATAAYVVGVPVYQPLDGYYYQSITPHTNQSPPNATYWGVLTNFERDIDYEPGATSNQGTTATTLGEVRNAWDANPRVDEGAAPQAFDITNDGLVVRGAEPFVWLEFRLRPNEFTGANHVVGTSYVVGDQVYYTVSGEYYINIGATSSALPTDTTKWTKLDFPYVLKDAVAQAAFADLLKVTGKTSKWSDELKEAGRLLQREFDKIERQQGQTRSLNVMTR